MTAVTRSVLHKIAIALAELWFWTEGHTDETAETTLHVYPSHLETNHEALRGKRIIITIAVGSDHTRK